LGLTTSRGTAPRAGDEQRRMEAFPIIVLQLQHLLDGDAERARDRAKERLTSGEYSLFVVEQSASDQLRSIRLQSRSSSAQLSTAPSIAFIIIAIPQLGPKSEYYYTTFPTCPFLSSWVPVPVPVPSANLSAPCPCRPVCPTLFCSAARFRSIISTFQSVSFSSARIADANASCCQFCHCALNFSISRSIIPSGTITPAPFFFLVLVFVYAARSTPGN
jgi:hypothetical protein